MKQTIIVQCKHRELQTESARFDVILDDDFNVAAIFVCLGAAPLDAAWLIDVRYQVDVAAPGAADLYGPAGWDVRMLAAWVSAFECGGTLPAPVTAVLTLPDLLERCAGHAAAGAAANG
jgi:hypothetical protein